jgi:DNA polymerase-3 subunit beta
VLEKGVFMEALARAALVAEDHIPVRLQLGDGGVEVTVTRQDVGGEVEQVEGAYKGEDESVLIAFNPRYLGDGVAVIQSDEIEIQVRDGQKPSVIRGVETDDFLYLLMPIRI